MKIKFVRSDLDVSAAFDTPEFADRINRASGVPLWKLGAVIDEIPFAVEVLVGNGDAEPADAEAEALCVNWQLRRSDVLLSRDMLARGIDPEDRERFKNGELLGYDAEGNDIPGPNWKGDVEE